MFEIKIFLAWYDGWIGYYYDRKSKALYICLIPMVVLKINKHQHNWIFEGCRGCPKSETGEGPKGCSQEIYRCNCGVFDYGNNPEFPGYKQCYVDCDWKPENEVES